MTKDQVQAKELRRQINLLFNYIKSSSVSQQIHLKRFLAKKLSLKTEYQLLNDFNFLGGFNNIEDSFRTIYVHKKQSFGSTLAHPLLPDCVWTQVGNFEGIQTLDIYKDTLSWEVETLLEHLEENQEITTVIFHGSNGLYAEIQEAISEIVSLERRITTLVFIEHPEVNEELLELIKSKKYDYFVWSTGISPIYGAVTQQLDQTVDLEPKESFLVWSVKEDSMTTKVTEFQAKPHTEIELGFMEALIYLLLEKLGKISKFEGFWRKLFFTHFWFNSKINSREEAENTLTELYPHMLLSTIPEVFFSLEKTEFGEEKLASAQTIYDFLVKKIASKDDGSLEVPALFTDRIYMEYFFYTTDRDKWGEYFEKKQLLSYSFVLADYLQDVDGLKNAKFIELYGLRLSLKTLPK